MSTITLNVCDAGRAVHGTVGDSDVDSCVAALSADPETIAELDLALARFLPAPDYRDFFAGWPAGSDATRADGGWVMIDLAARLVVFDPPELAFVPCAGVRMTDRTGEDVGVPYHVADDWLLTSDVPAAARRAESRRRERLAAPPLDARAVLYGPLCDHIAAAYWAEAATLDADATRAASSAIHARWLMTPRHDLAGQAPRDVLLARNHHIDRDVDHRSQQWSLVGSCPPGLSPTSAAYRFGAFGTHEIVVYYDLVRFLICDCWDQLAGATRVQPPRADALASEARRLEGLRDEWLRAPNYEDLSGRIPAEIIEHERARLPEGSTGKDHMIDGDCPLCQMMADDPGPMFWFLDGCNMDDDFAFSFHATRAEWEAEQREHEEFSRRFEEERAARSAEEGEAIWQRSYVADDALDRSPALVLFAVGTYISELTADLKDAGDADAMDTLNRIFSNLREVVGASAGALIEPVLDRLKESLDAVAEAHGALAAKCADLERRLQDLGRRLTAEALDDEDLPF